MIIFSGRCVGRGEEEKDEVRCPLDEKEERRVNMSGDACELGGSSSCDLWVR